MHKLDSNCIPELAALGHKIYTRGFVQATDGNLSCRTEAGFIITAAGAAFADLGPGELVLLDREGRPVPADHPQPAPSSELALHLALYRRRPEAQAVIHAHPPYCTVLSLLGTGLFTGVVEGAVPLPVAPHAPPGTMALAEAVAGLAGEYDRILLARHGVVTLGSSLRQAYWNLESAEQQSRLWYLTRLLER